MYLLDLLNVRSNGGGHFVTENVVPLCRSSGSRVEPGLGSNTCNTTDLQLEQRDLLLLDSFHATRSAATARHYIIPWYL